MSSEDTEDAKLRARRRRRATFPQVVMAVTALTHAVVVAPALGELLSRLGAPRPFLLSAAIAGALLLPLRGRLAGLMWDKPRSSWQLRLIDEPYFAHWSAAFFSAPFVLVGCLLAVLFDLVRGAPLAWPTDLVLVLYAASLLIAGYAVLVRRRWVVVRELDVPIKGLPRSFDGLKIAQLSDLHIGGLMPRGLPERWVALSNAGEPDVVAVTGDLVTSGEHFHDEIARVLSGLRAREARVVSMGNHDYFGEGDPLVAKLRASGLTVLRNDAMELRRGNDVLRICAVDDTWTGRADLDQTLGHAKDAPSTVLLAHDPDLFDRAAQLGAHLMLAGHTHAGQLAMPFLVKRLNLARIAHTYTYGLYRKGDAVLYVHAGLGTTGPPARLGAAPELVFLTLRSAELLCARLLGIQGLLRHGDGVGLVMCTASGPLRARQSAATCSIVAEWLACALSKVFPAGITLSALRALVLAW